MALNMVNSHFLCLNHEYEKKDEYHLDFRMILAVSMRCFPLNSLVVEFISTPIMIRWMWDEV